MYSIEKYTVCCTRRIFSYLRFKEYNAITLHLRYLNTFTGGSIDIYLHLIKFQKLARNVESVTVVPALLVARHGDTRHGHVSAAGHVSRVRLLAPRPVEDADARPEVLPRLLPVLLDAQVVDDGRAAAHHQDVNLAGEFYF